MGASDDIKLGLNKSLGTFAKQRKAEERHHSAGRFRASRMMEVRGKFLKEIAEEIMEECYMKVSDNNTLPAHVRQIFYVARPMFEKQTDRPLLYAYFSQTLVPNFMEEHDKQDWDVVYDDRGHFQEPHTGRMIGLGTLNVRNYLNRVADLKFEEADFDPASVKTYGPDGSFGALLFIEKEGFMPLFKRVKLAKRFDLGIMSTKGMSVVAARQLADGLNIPLLVLHDFDRSGIIIKDTLENDTRRYTYDNQLDVIDLGLNFDDITGFTAEPHTRPKSGGDISDERLREAGLDDDAIDFLDDQKVELNAMTSRQLVDFVERKLQEHNISKTIPARKTLKEAYELFAASDRLKKKFEELKVELDGEAQAIKVPKGLEAKVEEQLKHRPDITWHRAVQLIVNPDAPEDDDDDENDGEREDDEDFSDIDE